MTATNKCYNFVGFRCSPPLKMDKDSLKMDKDSLKMDEDSLKWMKTA